MITREIIRGELTTTVETDVLVAPEKESILEGWLKPISVNLTVTSHDTGQPQHGLLAATIDTSTHFEDSTT